MLGGEAEQGLEGGHRRAPAVEAEDELVVVVWQVFGADAVVGALQPGLEVREGPMHPREQLGGVLRVTGRRRAVIVGVAEWSVALPSVRQHDAARCHGCRDERQRRCG